MNITYKTSVFFLLGSAFLSAFLTFSGIIKEGLENIVFFSAVLGFWYYIPVVISLITAYMINEEKDYEKKQEFIIADKILNVLSVLYLIILTIIYIKYLSAEDVG